MSWRDVVTRPPRRPRRVLLAVGPGGIGDAAESLAAFQLLAERWPDVHVAAGIFKERQRPYMEASPYIDEVVRLHGKLRDIDKAWRAFWPNVAVLRGFDVVVFLHKYPYVAWPLLLAARVAGVRVLYRHGYRYREPRRSAMSDFPEHVLFQLATSNLLLRQPLAVARRSQLTLPDSARAYAEDFFRRTGLGGRPVVLLNTRHPDYEGYMGRWGIERFAAVANALAEGGADVVFNGGAPEQVAELAAVAGRLSERVFVVEGPDPLQLAAVIARCDLYLGEPSGPTCVAMAVATPTVSLVGPGENDYPGQNRNGGVWWPLPPTDVVVSKVDWCQRTMGADCRCSFPRDPTRARLKSLHLWDPLKATLKALRVYRRLFPPAGVDVYPCLEAITVADVVDAARAQLARSAGAQPAAAGDWDR